MSNHFYYMSYLETEAWEYLERRWGSWINVDSLTSLCTIVADFFDCNLVEFETVEQGVIWCQYFWPMVKPVFNNMTVYNRMGWEIDDSKEGRNLKYTPIPEDAKGGVIELIRPVHGIRFVPTFPH